VSAASFAACSAVANERRKIMARGFAFTPSRILILAAVVFFVLKAIGVDTDLDLVAVGLACFAGSFLI
jgi:hypothetical protein